MRKIFSYLKVFTSIVATVVLAMQPCRGNEEPFESWKLKADKGDPEAEFKLALMYARGTAVAKDDVEAYKWILLAGAQGHETAKSSIPNIEKRLTPEKRAEAQKRAHEFIPRIHSTIDSPH